MEQTLKVLGIIFLVTIFSLLAAWPTLWMINYIFTSTVLTTLFGGALTFWKAFWLNWVCSALFKGTGGK